MIDASWVAAVVAALAWVAFIGATGGVGMRNEPSAGARGGPDPGAQPPAGTTGGTATRSVETRASAPGDRDASTSTSTSSSTTVAVAPATVPVDLAAIAVAIVETLPADPTPVESALRACRRAGARVEVEVAVAHDAPAHAQVAVQVAVHEPDGAVRSRAAAITRPIAPRTAEVVVIHADGGTTEGPATCAVERLQAVPS